jgi:hypothetical protein
MPAVTGHFFIQRLPQTATVSSAIGDKVSATPILLYSLTH